MEEHLKVYLWDALASAKMDLQGLTVRHQ